MPIPRPKILSVVTVPTGGWQLKIYHSVTLSLDSSQTITIPAGDYFMANDRQSDDFIWQIEKLYNAAASHHTGLGIVVWIDTSTHKVKFGFVDAYYTGDVPQDVKIAWTELNGASVANVLGFDSAADDSSLSTNFPVFTADWHHAYGWYVDEDGSLRELLIEDIDNPEAPQSTAPSGHTKTHYISSRMKNQLSLAYIPRDKMHSGDVSYATASVAPYERNEPLQCWWKEARQGKRFRVYRNGYITSTLSTVVDTTSRAVDQGRTDNSAMVSTTLTDADKSWDIDPQEHKGRIIYVPLGINSVEVHLTAYISSHTATVMTIPNTWQNSVQDAPYYIFDHTYSTYWLDLSVTSRFNPKEIPKIDRFDFVIGLLKYVT